MSTEISSDLKLHFSALENEAYSLLRKGEYVLSEKIYRVLLETIQTRQETELRRIHKGSFYHMIGFSQILQDRVDESLKNFTLAYIEDILNAPFGKEGVADAYPAGRVIITGFKIDKKYLQKLKEMVIGYKKDDVLFGNPVFVLDLFFANEKIKNLVSLCDSPPTKEEVLDSLIIVVTPEAKQKIDKNTTTRQQEILKRARKIAKELSHKQVTSEDVQKALNEIVADKI